MPPASLDAPRVRREYGVGLIALGAITLEMAVSARYGYHRDELYFLVAGTHPALGYVDQPPLAPLAARVASVLFANSLVGLRVIPALLLGWLVVVAGSLARLLGGAATAQRLAALATALCGEYLATAHLLTTTIFDFAAWAGLWWAIAHFLVSERSRWLLVAGLFGGIGLDAKWNVAFVLATLAVGIAATPAARGLFARRQTVLAVVVIAALGWPDVFWQATHGWPNVAVFRALQHDAAHNRAVYWPAQVLYTGLAATPLWVAGWWSLWRRDAPDRRWRSLALASGIVLVLEFVLGGKPYYAGGVFVLLVAAGAVALERRVSARRARGVPTALTPRVVAAALVVTGLLSIVLALPVVPARTLHAVALQKINYDLAETIAWPREVSQVAALYRSLAPSERSRTIVLAGNYGEAGALERYGAQFGLPASRVFSGANSFWLWGPPPNSAVDAISLNMNPALLHRLFATVTPQFIYRNGLGVANDEQGVAVMISTGRRVAWSRSWREVQNYS